MADLRQRVAEKKARGLYSVDALMADRPTTDEPFAAEELERLRSQAVLRYEMAVIPSTKPVVGWVVTRVKRKLVRGTSEPGFRLAAQANAYHAALMAYLSQLGRELTALRHALQEIRAAVERAAQAVREAEVDRQRDLGQVEGRVEELAEELTELRARLAQETQEP